MNNFIKKEVLYYINDDKGNIICEVCPHKCRLKDGETGKCGVRTRYENRLYVENYGEISALSLDDIEKKPLFHYKPGSKILSCGSYGCNFVCGFCQNYSISQYKPVTKFMVPEELVKQAIESKQKGNIGLAFTYNEPFMFYEHMLETAKRCKSNNLDVVIVTNGYINEKPLKEILPFVDAMNIDLKAFSNDFYRKYCGGKIEHVLSTIQTVNESCHLELTTLLISGYNDSLEEVEEIAKWIKSINDNIPLHLSRYYPNYKFTVDATDTRRIKELRDIARKHLKYVYIGNIPDVDNNTYCPDCGELIIERSIYDSKDKNKSINCRKCNNKLNIVF